MKKNAVQNDPNSEKERLKALVNELFDSGKVKVTYTVQTVYSCIKHGDTVVIEDNRQQIIDEINADKMKNLKAK